MSQPNEFDVYVKITPVIVEQTINVETGETVSARIVPIAKASIDRLVGFDQRITDPAILMELRENEKDFQFELKQPDTE